MASLGIRCRERRMEVSMGQVQVYIGGCGIVWIAALGRISVGLEGMSMRTEQRGGKGREEKRREGKNIVR
jgi:hypothetical protein